MMGCWAEVNLLGGSNDNDFGSRSGCFECPVFLLYSGVLREGAAAGIQPPVFPGYSQGYSAGVPRLRDSANASSNYSDVCFDLKCDFVTLEFLLKNSDPSRRHLSSRERVLVLYFRFL